MKLIWHIVKKDCLHLRWLLAAWLAVFGAQIALGVWAQGGSDAVFQSASPVTAANWILFDLQLLVAMLLTVEIVQADLLVEPKAHWLTLPISEVQLLAGKLAGVILLVWLLPALLLWPWWLVNHWGLAELALGTTAFVLLHMLVSLPALLIAVLTDNWTRFVTWAFVFVVFALAVVVSLRVRHEAILVEVRPPETAFWSQIAAGAIVLAAVIMAVVLNQYLTRRRSRSLLAVSIGSLVAGLVMAFWRPDFVATMLDASERDPLPEAHLQMNLGSVSGGTKPPSSGDQASLIGLNVEGAFGGLASEDTVYGQLLDLSWKWPNGGVWRSTHPRGPFLERTLTFFASRTRGNESDGPSLFPRQAAIDSLGTPQVPTYVAQRLLAEPAEFRAKVGMAIIHREVLAELMPQPGSHFGRGSERYTVHSVQRGKGEVSLMMIQTLPLLPGYPKEFRPFPAMTSRSFAFSNRSNPGAARTWVNRTNNVHIRKLGPFLGVYVSRFDHVLAAPLEYFPDRPVGERSALIDPRWAEDFTMYWTESRPIARMETEIVEPHFVTRAEMPSQSPALRTLRPKR